MAGGMYIDHHNFFYDRMDIMWNSLETAHLYIVKDSLVVVERWHIDIVNSHFHQYMEAGVFVEEDIVFVMPFLAQFDDGQRNGSHWVL